MRFVGTHVSSCAHPSLPSVIRGLLTRRVAPAPARQSFTLESNPRPPSCVSSLSRDTRRPVASVSSTKDSIGRSWLAESRASRTEHASEKTRRRREPYWRRSLTTLPLLAWRPSDCSTSRALCIYRRYIDIRATQSPRFLSRRRRRRRHARGRDRHVSSHVSAGALRREAACWRQELKAQASVWRVSFCKDSAPDPRSMLIVTTRLNRFDPI